jgi:hypothetical protein
MMANNDHSAPELDARFADDNYLYYAITLTADDDLKVTVGMHSRWVGWADDKRRHELREARLVYREFVLLWEGLNHPYSIVQTLDELVSFLVNGGHALVEKALADKVLQDLLNPSPSVPVGLLGFKDRGMFDESAFRKAPSPKVRMQVIKRDGRRCRICGRRPDDNTDLELHVHHIRPWADGGVTDLSNLVTLCHTCHTGLTPHYDPALHSYVDAANDIEFFKGVSNYRKAGWFGDLTASNTNPS